jgi:beta-lactamase regulating signal transducer with metallopeptidase domain
MTMTLLLLALKSLLVAAAALGLLRLTRSRSAAQRSTIAHLGLVALVVLPLGSLALPNLPLPVPVPQFAAIDPAVRPTPAVLTPSRMMTATRPVGPPASAAAPAVDGRWVEIGIGAARYAFLVPTILLLALTLVALLRLVGLRARAEILVDPVWLSALARAQRRMGFKSGTALLRSDELGSPVSWGLMRPVILLNHEAVEAPEQAEAILAHELAHVVHLDWAKLILARVATAAFWFNPLAWVLAREAHQLREEAADDAVLAADIAGPDYAQLLIGVARHQCRATLLGAHGVAPSKSSLGRRVRRVLDQSPARGPSGRSWIAGFATGMVSMAVPLAAVTIVPARTVVAIARPAPARPTVSHPVLADAPRAAVTAEAAAYPTPAARKGAAAPATADEQPAWVETSEDFKFAAAAGISDDYRREMAAAGFPGLSIGELGEARAVDVTPAFARAMRATGMPLRIHDVVEARAMGMDPAYIAAMRRYGINGTLNDYQGMRAVGVTADFVGKLRKRGITTTSPDELTGMRAVSDDPDPDP